MKKAMPVKCKCWIGTATYDFHKTCHSFYQVSIFQIACRLPVFRYKQTFHYDLFADMEKRKNDFHAKRRRPIQS